MASIERIIQMNQSPIASNLGTPVSTKPATGPGIFNSTVGTSATKVLSAATNPLGKARRVKLHNPTSGVSLSYTTAFKDDPTPTLTASTAGGGVADGSPVPAQSTEWFIIFDNADLYLSASALASPYSLTIVEV